jgi:hypothetical protein
MRRRITKALVAAAAAGSTITTMGLAAAGSAAAAVHGGKSFAPSAPVTPTSTHCTVTTTVPVKGIPSDGCAMAGYTASNRNFRYAQALITVPNHAGDPDIDPQIFVALDASTTDSYTYVRAGVTPCGGSVGTVDQPALDCTSGWEAYVEAYRNGTDVFADFEPLTDAVEGDQVFASLYREPSGNVVDARVVLPNSRGNKTFTFAVGMAGTTFTMAQALADWTNAHANGTAVAPLPASPVDVRTTQFMQGAFTTVSGERGTFKGPWTRGALDATTNGTTLGTIVEEPAYLWNDGTGNGFGDAFGVWQRVS